MAEEKKYYWIKLKDSFMTSDAVDFLMGQKDGANYIVLYQMLCLKTANTDGRLERRIGEMIIPYDVEKIARDSKWFSVDTVRVALELYKALGLVYVDDNGCLVMAKHSEMVGCSKTDDHTKMLGRERQQRFRENQKKQLAENSVTVTQDVTDDVTLNRNADIRDKILEIRDKDIRDIDKDIDIDIDTEEKKTKAFIKPTLSEVQDYIRQMRYQVDAEAFIAFYESNGWKVGKNPMKSWKSALVTWQKRRESGNSRGNAREATVDRLARLQREGR